MLRYHGNRAVGVRICSKLVCSFYGAETVYLVFGGGRRPSNRHILQSLFGNGYYYVLRAPITFTYQSGKVVAVFVVRSRSLRQRCLSVFYRSARRHGKHTRLRKVGFYSARLETQICNEDVVHYAVACRSEYKAASHRAVVAERGKYFIRREFHRTPRVAYCDIRRLIPLAAESYRRASVIGTGAYIHLEFPSRAVTQLLRIHVFGCTGGYGKHRPDFLRKCR